MTNVLVLGGTGFLGAHLVRFLALFGHDVTLSTRGTTNPDLFEDVPKLNGDRDGDMSRLAGTSWDVIYDLSGQHPRHVRDVAALVNDDAHYVFISTGNVYSDMSVEGPLTEDSPVFDVAEGDVDPNSMDAYGQFKALSESEVRRRFARHHIVRPGVIVGLGDPSDRLTYWVMRFADSGRHIVPEAIDASLQFIDVRDLAEWLVHLGMAAESGTFNAVAPPTTLSSFLSEVERVAGSSVDRIGISESFLEDHQIRPWLDIPMWLPPSDTSRHAFFNVEARLARHHGLKTRSAEENIRGILDCSDGVRLRDHPRHGLSAAKEVDLVGVLGAP
ncbi:NAD-dependent epimerase/dehydratase family protein [Kocuria atrinae]|uniref:SDR family oxidoreductase n=1 Tax=Kocuria atrinae TaxID=592377 RepID=A0ABN2XLE6_9MICC